MENLAEQRNMSVSLFHQKFKSAVGMGPLQCQKRLRLTEARRLMLDDSKNVTEASLEVGYESVSQFIRDYRKMFGSAPKEDILNIQNFNSMEVFQMILTDEICDKLCAAAREKSKEIGIDICFAVSDEHGLPRVYRRYGEALALSITLVPGKAYTAAVTQCKTKDVASAAAEGASLMAIQTNDPRITLVAGGYPLFVNGKIAGGIGVGGGTEEQDCKIAEYVVSVFEKLAC